MKKEGAYSLGKTVSHVKGKKKAKKGKVKGKGKVWKEPELYLSLGEYEQAQLYADMRYLEERKARKGTNDRRERREGTERGQRPVQRGDENSHVGQTKEGTTNGHKHKE